MKCGRSVPTVAGEGRLTTKPRYFAGGVCSPVPSPSSGFFSRFMFVSCCYGSWAVGTMSIQSKSVQHAYAYAEFTAPPVGLAVFLLFFLRCGAFGSCVTIFVYDCGLDLRSLMAVSHAIHTCSLD